MSSSSRSKKSSRRKKSSKEIFHMQTYSIKTLLDKYHTNPMLHSFLDKYIEDYIIKISRGKFKTFKLYYLYLVRLNNYIKEISPRHTVRMIVYYKNNLPVAIQKIVYYTADGFFEVYPSLVEEFKRLKYKIGTRIVYKGNLWIDPLYRGKGFCKPFLVDLLQVLKKEKVSYVVNSIHETNIASQKCAFPFVKTKVLEYDDTYFYISKLKK